MKLQTRAFPYQARLIPALALLALVLLLSAAPAPARQPLPGAASLARASAANPRDARPDWSLIVYVATDEEDLAKNYDPRIARMFSSELPGNVELVAERDSFRPDGVERIIRRGAAAPETVALPEADSSSPEHLADFLAWAKQNARGKKKLFLVITHSWGWRGIIQDFTLPGRPGENAMMPLSRFAKTLVDSQLKPDLLWVDACVLGTLECIEEFKRTAPLLLLSQRETPYGGFPHERLLPLLAANPTPREFARTLPGRYVEAYGHNGNMSTEEGEYFITCWAAIDTAKWDPFARQFAAFVRLLKQAGLREKLAANPDWAKSQADPLDQNGDLVQFLTDVPALVPDPRVARAARSLLARIGYPEKIAALTAETVTLDPARGASFELRVDTDGLLTGNKTLENIKTRWKEANLGLPQPPGLSFNLVGIPSPSGRDREFVVSGNLTGSYRFRPWLAGTQYYTLSQTGADNRTVRVTRARESDVFVADRFPSTSFLVSEAHTQGAPFLHGVGMLLYPEMDETMERAKDPATGLAGPRLYRAMPFSRRTGWGEATLLAP